MTMKRMRDGEHESVSIANCLMLLSRGTDYDSIARVPVESSSARPVTGSSRRSRRWAATGPATRSQD
ncbi:hypothetical protein CK203_080215 [Vitis vinifera]|uniref:Uncharacterized protein n=1 Tax=Vitis vinifera TaxID=29760 RepID=A0A438EP06_VITVI|nr:hypothetical protein CK203_080215 [Vitis vinifera]